MIDAMARRRLSQNLRRLVTGRMTNDEFDRCEYDLACQSDDRAVRKIADFGYSLYSSDLPWAYRLKGVHRVTDEVRLIAVRSILFLRSGLEYEWPNEPDNSVALQIGGVAIFLGIPVGVALLVVSIPLLVDHDPLFGLPFLLATLVILPLSLWLVFVYPSVRRGSPAWEAFRAAGNIEIWPFLRQTDFEFARHNCHLLAKWNSSNNRSSDE
ncbi:MAG TPA: hypothetical protein VHC22_17400 [Pirellulales bacterium]|nr:hypothetical protein [Pirellulales bacterium]